MQRISAFMPRAINHHKTPKWILIKVPDLVILLISYCKKLPKEKSSLAADGKGCIWLLEPASEEEFLAQSLFHAHAINFSAIHSQQKCWYRHSLRMQLKNHQSQQNPELGHFTSWLSALSSGLLKKGLYSSDFSRVLRWCSFSVYLSLDFKKEA